MKANSKRKLQLGTEFDKYYPTASGKDVVIEEKATVDDTIKEIKSIVYGTMGQTEKISKVLLGNNDLETFRNIWDHYYNHIQYKEDKKFCEQLREPARLWMDRAGDCDCYSISISQILINLGVPHFLRITKYPKPWPQVPNWQHIYVIVPKDGNLNKDYDYKKNRKDYFVIDCVTDHFDYEVPYFEKKDYDMQLARLSGFGDTDLETEPNIISERNMGSHLLGIDENEIPYIKINNEDEWAPFELGMVEGLGKKSKAQRKEFKAKRKEYKVKRKEVKKLPKSERKAARQELKLTKPKTGVGKFINKAAKVLNKLNPATVLLRNGILAAMKMNMSKLASKYRYGYLTQADALARGMDLKEWKKVHNEVLLKEQSFERLGGEKKSFKNAILKGKGNKKEPVLGGIDDFELEGFEVDHLLEGLYEPIEGYDEFDGLGEPATAATGTAVASAVALIAKWAKSMKGVTNLFPKNKAKNDEFNSDAPDPSEAQDYASEVQKFAPGAAEFSANQIQNLKSGVESGAINVNALTQQVTGEDVAPSGEKSTQSIEMSTPAQNKSTGSGETQSNNDGEDNSPAPSNKPNTWIMPVGIGVGVLALAGVAFALISNKSKPISGVESDKPKKVKNKKLEIINL